MFKQLDDHKNVLHGQMREGEYPRRV